MSEFWFLVAEFSLMSELWCLVSEFLLLLSEFGLMSEFANSTMQQQMELLVDCSSCLTSCAAADYFAIDCQGEHSEHELKLFGLLFELVKYFRVSSRAKSRAADPAQIFGSRTRLLMLDNYMYI